MRPMFPDGESDVEWPSKVAVKQVLFQGYPCGVIHLEGVPTLGSSKMSREIKGVVCTRSKILT